MKTPPSISLHELEQLNDAAKAVQEAIDRLKQVLFQTAMSAYDQPYT